MGSVWFQDGLGRVKIGLVWLQDGFGFGYMMGWVWLHDGLGLVTRWVPLDMT